MSIVELMFIFPIVAIKSSFIHFYGFQLLVLLGITSLICINKMNLMGLKWNSERILFVPKGFLKLPNLLVLIKQNNLSLARNMTLATFGELFLAFSTNLIELYLVYLMVLRCSLLNLISQSYLLKFFVRLLILLTKVSLYLFYHVELIWTAWCSWTFHIDWEGHNRPQFLARVWLWLYFSSGSEDLSTWTFMDISWTSQYVSERILFPDCPKLSYVVPVFRNVR